MKYDGDFKITTFCVLLMKRSGFSDDACINVAFLDNARQIIAWPDKSVVKRDECQSMNYISISNYLSGFMRKILLWKFPLQDNLIFSAKSA